jgi:ectoine hydroxylase-related dioxygenase (phytanoyl-CoA dioxygenase family)
MGWFCREHDGGEAFPVPVKAGDVVVFSSLTPHRTGPNVTKNVRKTYILQYAPDGARVVDGEPCSAPDRQFLILKNGKSVAPPEMEKSS